MTILSWTEAIEDVGCKYYGDDWIRELTHRELWLIYNYGLADLCYPTFDVRPVVPSSMRDELERALDRQACMLDQQASVADFLKGKGYAEGKPIDNPRLDQPRNGPGAVDLYDWDEIEQVVGDLWQKRGDFDLPDNRGDDWKSQSSVIEHVKIYLQKHNRKIPGDTQLKKRVGEIIVKLRRPE